MEKKFGKIAYERFGWGFLGIVENFEIYADTEFKNVFADYARWFLEMEAIWCIEEKNPEYAKSILMVVTTMLGGDNALEVTIEDVNASFFRKELKDIFDDQRNVQLIGESLGFKIMLLLLLCED